MKKKTTPEFIVKANLIHNEEYDYSKSIYINVMTKVIVSCPQHGDWEVTPDNHINKKSGCPKCKGFNLTKDEKINLACKVHNNRYDYSLILDIIISQVKKYDIICPKHGVFQQFWNNHYTMGQGCPKCNIAGRRKILEGGQKNSWSKDYTRSYMNNYRKQRCKTDPQFKLMTTLRDRLSQSIKKYLLTKKDSSINLIGIPIEDFVSYIEEKFVVGYMNWKNHGKIWELDHIIPISSFDLTQEEQLKECFYYTNYQPLFKFTTIIDGVEYIGNRNKSNKII